MQAKTQEVESSFLTAYENDDEVWRNYRRALFIEGLTSAVIRKHEKTIKEYITELGARGALDDVTVDEGADSLDITSGHRDSSGGAEVPIKGRGDSLKSEQWSLAVDQPPQSSRHTSIDETALLQGPSPPDAMENVRGVKGRPLNIGLKRQVHLGTELLSLRLNSLVREAVTPDLFQDLSLVLLMGRMQTPPDLCAAQAGKLSCR
jgi:hypothetical protein